MENTTTRPDIDFLPGTSYLVETDSHNQTSHLLRHGDILLSPQPTASPNDPLNWSFPRKYWHVFLVCFITGLTAATSNDAGSTQYGQNTDLNISYNAMNTAAGVLFIGIGYWTLLMSPAAWLYGRRITYLVCLTLGVIGAIWLAKVKTTNDSVWNQLFVGASEACAEANVQLSLSDLFFQHQRGTVIGIYVLATSIGTYLGPLIGGYIADSSMGWRWVGWWSVIISCGTILVCIFTLEETVFDRPKIDQPDEITDRETRHGKQSPELPTEKNALDQAPSENPSELPQAESTDRPKTYWQRMKLITPAPNLIGLGFKQYLTRLLHTLRVFSFPAVIYSGIQWGAQDAWLTFYLTLEEDNWTSDPYDYSDVGSGIMNVPCLIGAVIGCFYGGYLSDKFVLWRAKRRGGIREAEDRLWLMYACAILSPTGMLLFGIGTAKFWSWPVPYVGLGMIGFGWGCAGDLSMAYLMDAYPEMVLEGMVGVAVINNTIGMIFTFSTSPWLAASGTQNTMIATGVLDFFFIMLTVPMMIWGKSARRWTRGRYEEFIRIRDSL
ncbi:putative MFS-type transporter [Hyphodiscus hymeniophilus]|uniref:MFS-type transporter n=1 Tax=Hyphodiscus hymeniophilus TaxID=353542 RepID=A0A9P6VNL5_9HELO|nr:putative MFS-type transporter [Hyphodiscus hymeniophilus]